MIELSAGRKPRRDETAGVADHVLTRIKEGAPYGVWSRIDFLDLGGSYAVEKALQRLVKRGQISRVLRGLYALPTQDPLTGRWQNPPILSFVDAICRRDQMKILVDGITAAHALGLTDTTPFSTIIYAKTRPRRVTINARIGHRKAGARFSYRLNFKRFSLNRPDFWAGHPSMLLIQAFDWMHDQSLDLNAAMGEVIQTLNSQGSGPAIATDLRANMGNLPSWMQPFMLQISEALNQPANTSEVDTDGSLHLSSTAGEQLTV